MKEIDIKGREKAISRTKNNLFFIVGSGRCGTTLLRTIMCTHNDICIPCETHFYTTFKKLNFLQYRRMNGEKFKQAVKNYKNQHHVKDEKVDWKLFEEIALSHESSWDSIFLSFLTAYRIEEGKNVVGEKTPGHVRKIFKLKEKFPNAKFIHIIRDPRAVVSSYKRHSLYKYAYGDNIIRAVSKWNKAIKIHFKALQELHDDDYFYLFYEDLVRQPKAEVESLCDFLGVDFNNNMIEEFTDNDISINNQDSKNHEGINKPIYTSSITSWKEELKGRQIGKIGYLCGKYMNKLGYVKQKEDFNLAKMHLLKDYIEFIARFLSFAIYRVFNR